MNEILKRKFCDEIASRICLKPYPYGTGIHIYHNVDRATGKTYDLIKYASKNGITILSSNPHFKKYVISACEDLHLYIPKVVIIRNIEDFINFMTTEEYFVIDELEAFFSNVFYSKYFRGCSVRAKCIKSAYLENVE